MKKICCPYDISIHTNVHQNWSINKCAIMIFGIKVVLNDIGLDDFKVILHLMQDLHVLMYIDILEKFLKDDLP